MILMELTPYKAHYRGKCVNKRIKKNLLFYFCREKESYARCVDLNASLK